MIEIHSLKLGIFRSNKPDNGCNAKVKKLIIFMKTMILEEQEPDEGSCVSKATTCRRLHITYNNSSTYPHSVLR
jgi:hypothetical protein